MESAQEDVKPIIPADDGPAKVSLTVPPADTTIGKFKHSRYEDVWPEDVHAAFMEAVALYPPMGKRRFKYYQVSTRENEHPLDANRTKSFGRCQLIQSYILEKTGKNRTRKQVSSHLQRLKKVYKDNPAMQPLFLERSHLPSEHYSGSQVMLSQDSSIPSSAKTSESASASHLNLKSDLDFAINLQDTDAYFVSSSTLATVSEPSSLNGGPCHAFKSSSFHEQPSPPEFLLPAPQQCQTVASHPSDSDMDYLPESQGASLFKDTVNEGFRSDTDFNAFGLGFSTSLRRFASQLPIHGRPIDSSPAMHFSRAVHSLGFQPTHHWVSRDSLMDSVYHSSPLTSEETFHTPFLPLQSAPAEKQKLYPGLASEWPWPKDSDLSFDPREGPFARLRLRYHPTMYQFNHPYLKMGVDTPGFNSSPSESEMSRLPKVFSYSHTITGPATIEASRLPRGIACSYSVTDPATATNSFSNENAIDFPGQSPESSENPASPFLIRPTPVYPISYIHSHIHSSVRSDDLAPAPTLSP